MRKFFLLLGLTFLLAGVAFSQIREISGFKVPDYDEDNNLKSQLSGDKARFETEEKIHITNLKIESYTDNEVDLTITSPECTYNRRHKTAQSQSRIRIDRDNMVITGEDFIYDSQKKVFIIKKDVKVVLIGRGGTSAFGEGIQ